MKILVVKADEGHANWQRAFLGQLGNEVVTAHDCLTALQVAATFRPDVIVTGLKLHPLDGWELARRLRTMPTFAATRIYAISAWNCDEAIRLSMAAGMDYHFGIPCRMEDWLLIHEARAITPAQAEFIADSPSHHLALEAYLQRKGSASSWHDRKFLLAKCACARRVSHLLEPDDFRAIARAERLADGEVLEEKVSPIAPPQKDIRNYLRLCLLAFPGSAFDFFARLRDCSEDAEAETAAQRAIVEDVFGPAGWRPVAGEPPMLDWRDRTVLRLAQASYAERAFDILPILADALEDAGCDNETILNHCRGPGPHVRGCWVVDLLKTPCRRSPELLKSNH